MDNMNHNSSKSDAVDTSNMHIVEPPMAAADRVREWNGESQSLLHSHEDGLSEESEIPRKKEVQWLDKNGDELAEILEFQPRVI
ncbi:hypothetical protein OROMI_032771 [Orobanche minor]